MPILYDPATGQPVQIADPNEAAAALASGKLGFLKDSKVPVVTPDGRRGTVPAANVGTALSRGFRLQSDDELDGNEAEAKLSGAEQVIGAASAGALDALTGGFSNQFLTGAAERPQLAKRRLRDLEKASPTATTVGRLGGTAVGLGMGASVPGMAAKASTATAAKLGGGTLAKAAGAGIEGGIYGLGQVVSENALTDNPNLTAEKLFAGAAAGVFTGAGLSLFGTGLAKGGSALMSKMGGKGMRELLREHANKLAIRQYARPAELRAHGLTPDEIQKIGEYGHTRKLFGMGAEETQKRAAAQSAKEGLVIERVLNQVDRAGKKFDPAVFTARAQQELVDVMEGNPALKEAQAKLNEYLATYRRYGPGGDLPKLSFKEAWNLRSKLLEKTGHGEVNFGVKQELRKLQWMLREEITRQAGVNGGKLREMLIGASRRYRNAEVIEELAEKAVQRSLGNRITSLSDMLFGLGGVGIGQAAAAGGLGGIVGGAVGGFALGLGNKWARENAGSIVSSAMHKLATGQAIGKLGGGLKKAIDTGLRASPTFGGVFRAELERAAASGAADLLATHVGLAQSDPTYLSAVGMADETPEAANDYAVRADQLASIEAAADAQDQAMDRAIDGILGNRSGRAPKVDRSRLDAKAYRKAFDQLEEMATNPAVLMNIADPGELANVAPGIAGALSMTAARAVNYLYAMAPKNPNRNPIAALDLKWAPSNLELARWGRHFSTVQDPTRVLADIEAGTLTWEQVDTLKNVYPEMLSQLQQRMMERLAGHKKVLTFPQRTMLSRLFGAPMGGAGDRRQIALIQEMHQATMQQQPGGKSSESPGDGRQDVSVVENHQTQSQRIESRGMA